MVYMVVSGITFIGYAHYPKIWKAKKSKYLWEQENKETKQDAQNWLTSLMYEGGTL